MLLTRLKVNMNVASAVIVIHLFGHVHVYAPGDVHHFLERIEIQSHDSINMHTGQKSFHRGLRELISADRVIGVDLLLVVAGHSAKGVARNAKPGDSLVLEIKFGEEHHIASSLMADELLAAEIPLFVAA